MRAGLGRLSRGGRLLVGLAVAGAVFGIATAVQAAIPDASGVIHGCYQKNAGNLRVIDPKTDSCHSSEIGLNWNQAGPTGARGPSGARGPTGARGPSGARGPTGPKGTTGDKGPTGAKGTTGVRGPTGTKGPTGAKGPTGSKGPTGGKGPTGPSGANGVSGYAIQSITGTIAAGQSAQGTALCGGNKRATGGGWDAGEFVTPPNTSSPVPDGSGWTGAITNNTGGPLAVTFYVVCINATSSSAPAQQTSASQPAGRATIKLRSGG
jgi:hypothetical protein